MQRTRVTRDNENAFQNYGYHRMPKWICASALSPMPSPCAQDHGNLVNMKLWAHFVKGRGSKSNELAGGWGLVPGLPLCWALLHSVWGKTAQICNSSSGRQAAYRLDLKTHRWDSTSCTTKMPLTFIIPRGHTELHPGEKGYVFMERKITTVTSAVVVSHRFGVHLSLILTGEDKRPFFENPKAPKSVIYYRHLGKATLYSNCF